MWKIDTERGDLFDVNMMITMGVKASGSFSEKRVVDAFNKAVKSYEILNTKVLIDNEGHAFYERNNENNNKVFFTSTFLKRLINEQEKKRFHIEDGEYLRLFVSIEKDESSFIFMLHHLGGDGKSLLYFIETIIYFRKITNFHSRS